MRLFRVGEEVVEYDGPSHISYAIGKLAVPNAVQLAHRHGHASKRLGQGLLVCLDSFAAALKIVFLPLREKGSDRSAVTGEDDAAVEIEVISG